MPIFDPLHILYCASGALAIIYASTTTLALVRYFL
jgi:hypothetical protein